MTTTAAAPRTKTTDILEIAQALDGKVNFSDIKFSQCLPCAHGENVNHLLFVKKQYGIYFYTNKTSFENLANLTPQKFEVWAVCPNSKNMYTLTAGL